MAAKKNQANYESTLDSLNTYRVSYESKVDSLLFLRATCDSLNKRKIDTVTQYKFIQSIQYLESTLDLTDTIEWAVKSDTDSIALLRLEHLREINKSLTELEGYKIRDSICTNLIELKDSIIQNLDEQLEVKDKAAKQKSKKSFWKGFGAGVITIGGLLWIL